MHLVTLGALSEREKHSLLDHAVAGHVIQYGKVSENGGNGLVAPMCKMSV